MQREAGLHETRDRIVRWVLISGAVASLLPQAALAFYAFPSADDYCVAVPPRAGFWQAQAFWYTSWTGRYAAMLVESVVTRWDLSQMYPWFVLTTLAGTGLAIHAVIGTLITGPQRRVAALVVTAVFVGGLPSTVEAFYWMPSAVSYQWGLIVLGLWAATLLTLVTRPIPAAGRTRRRAALVALSLLVPGFNEVMAPLILTTLLGAMLVNRRRRLESNRFLLTVLAVVVVLTAVSFLAPGNGARSLTYPDLPTRHNLAYSVTETGRQTVRFLRFGAYPALWLAAVAAWWWRRTTPAAEATGASPRLLAAGLALLGSLMFLSLFPLYWVYGSVNYTGEGRTYNVTYVPLVAAVVISVALALGAFARRFPKLLERLSIRRTGVDYVLACALALLLVAAPSTRRAARALAVAPEYAGQQREREALLRNGPRNATVFVDEMSIRPEGLFWGDLQPDEENWINKCVADYYQLKAVRTRR